MTNAVSIRVLELKLDALARWRCVYADVHNQDRAAPCGEETGALATRPTGCLRSAGAKNKSKTGPTWAFWACFWVT